MNVDVSHLHGETVSQYHNSLLVTYMNQTDLNLIWSNSLVKKLQTSFAINDAN